MPTFLLLNFVSCKYKIFKMSMTSCSECLQTRTTTDCEPLKVIILNMIQIKKLDYQLVMFLKNEKICYFMVYTRLLKVERLW